MKQSPDKLEQLIRSAFKDEELRRIVSAQRQTLGLPLVARQSPRIRRPTTGAIRKAAFLRESALGN